MKKPSKFFSKIFFDNHLLFYYSMIHMCSILSYITYQFTTYNTYSTRACMKESISTDCWVSYSATCLLTLVINVTWKALNEFGESRGSSCQLGRQFSQSFAPHSCFRSTVKGNVFWQNFRDSPCSCGQPRTLL